MCGLIRLGCASLSSSRRDLLTESVGAARSTLRGRPEYGDRLPRFESWPHYLLGESRISFSLPEPQLCKMGIKIPFTS